jgi:hypothetical protein
MLERKSIADLIAAGLRLQPDEAIALIQEVIAALGSYDGPPGAMPSLGNTFVDSEGTVVSEAASQPTVASVGALLEAMLPDDSVKMSGALRYALARLRGAVDAPSFASVADLSNALRRQEKHARVSVLRELYARAIAAHWTGHVRRPVERRRMGPAVSDLRRELRALDQERYLMLKGASNDPDPPVAVEAPTSSDAIADWHDTLIHDTPGLVHDTFRPTGLTTARRRWAPPLAAAAAIVAAFFIGYAALSRVPAERASQESPTPDTTASAPPPSAVPADVASGSAAAGAGPSAPLNDSQSQDLEPSILRPDAASTTPMYSPSFASNGRTIFFHTGATSGGRSALRALDLSDGGNRVTTIVDDGARNYHVKASPAGDLIAYDSDRDGVRGVYVANRDGSGFRRVSGDGYAAVPTWSPDGKQLAFVRAEPRRARVWNLWLLTLDTGVTERLTEFAYGQTWTGSWFPDGKRLAYAHEDRLYIRDLTTGGVQQFHSPLRGRLVRTPAVSPDGSHVVFQVWRDGTWLLDVSSGAMTRVLADSTAEEFAWSPDGRLLAFHSRRTGHWGVWLLRL